MNFNRFQECKDESFIIPSSLFQIVKPFAFVEIHYELNETKSKHFFEKLQKFTNNSFRMAIMWKTRNRQSLFPLKDKDDYKSCVFYKGYCSCDLRYIGETKRNTEVRWSEHNNPTISSEPSNTFEATSTSILHGLSFQILQKMLRTRKT